LSDLNPSKVSAIYAKIFGSGQTEFGLARTPTQMSESFLLSDSEAKRFCRGVF